MFAQTQTAGQRLHQESTDEEYLFFNRSGVAADPSDSPAMEAPAFERALAARVATVSTMLDGLRAERASAIVAHSDAMQKTSLAHRLELPSHLFRSSAKSYQMLLDAKAGHSWTERTLFQLANQTVLNEPEKDHAVAAGHLLIMSGVVNLNSEASNPTGPVTTAFVDAFNASSFASPPLVAQTANTLKSAFVLQTIAHPRLGVLPLDEFKHHFVDHDKSGFVVLAATAEDLNGFAHTGLNAVLAKTNECDDPHSRALYVPPRNTKADKGALWYIDNRLACGIPVLTDESDNRKIYGCCERPSSQKDGMSDEHGKSNAWPVSKKKPAKYGSQDWVTSSVEARAKERADLSAEMKVFQNSYNFLLSEEKLKWAMVEDASGTFTLSDAKLVKLIEANERQYQIIVAEKEGIQRVIDMLKEDTQSTDAKQAELDAKEAALKALHETTATYREHLEKLNGFQSVIVDYINFFRDTMKIEVELPVRFTSNTWSLLKTAMTYGLKRLSLEIELQTLAEFARDPDSAIAIDELAHMKERACRPLVATDIAQLGRFTVAPTTVPMASIHDTAGAIAFSSVMLNLPNAKDIDTCSFKVSYLLLRVPEEACM